MIFMAAQFRADEHQCAAERRAGVGDGGPKRGSGGTETVNFSTANPGAGSLLAPLVPALRHQLRATNGP